MRWSTRIKSCVTVTLQLQLQLVIRRYPVGTRPKLNVHKTFRRHPGHLLNVLCTFNLCPVSTDQGLRYTFHVNQTATSCILDKSTSQLLCALSVLEPARYEQTSALTDSVFKYCLNSPLCECKYIFEGTGALKNFGLNIQNNQSLQSCVQKPRSLPFLKKKQVENEI